MSDLKFTELSLKCVSVLPEGLVIRSDSIHVLIVTMCSMKGVVLMITVRVHVIYIMRNYLGYTVCYVESLTK